MVNFTDLTIGGLCTIIKAYVKENNIDTDFTKNSKRPFVIAEITDWGIIWVVPCFSHCYEYSNLTKQFYFTLYTPNGDIKYLNYRNMIPVSIEDISSIYSPSNNTIQTLHGDQLLNFLSKYRSNKKYLKQNLDKSNTLFKNPFGIEKKYMKKYLLGTYRWLERDFNIVDSNRNFSIIEEFEKTEFANVLYHNYLENLKHFLISRNTYLPVRKDKCISYFNTYKMEILYKCYTDNGYILSLNPLCYTDSFNHAAKISEDDLQQIKEDYVYEPISSEAPLLNAEEEKKIASELIWLDNNIVSQKTYYDVYGKLPGKQEIKSKIEDAKRKSV